MSSKLYLDNIEIERVTYHKHLGIIFADDLKGSHHINKVVELCSRKLEILRKLRFKLDRKSMETVYFSFIRPTIEYGDVLYSGASLNDLGKLDKIQRESLLLVTGGTWNCHNN